MATVNNTTCQGGELERICSLTKCRSVTKILTIQIANFLFTIQDMARINLPCVILVIPPRLTWISHWQNCLNLCTGTGRSLVSGLSQRSSQFTKKVTKNVLKITNQQLTYAVFFDYGKISCNFLILCLLESPILDNVP